MDFWALSGGKRNFDPYFLSKEKGSDARREYGMDEQEANNYNRKKKLELGSAPKPQGYLGHNQDNSIVTDHNRTLNL